MGESERFLTVQGTCYYGGLDMKQANWKVLAYIFLGLSVLFLAVGAGAALISTQGDYIPLSGNQYETVYPYQVFGLVLLLVAGVLLIVGASFVCRGRVEQLPPP